MAFVSITVTVAVTLAVAVTVTVSAARDRIVAVAALAAVGRDIVDASGEIRSALSEVADSLKYRGNGEHILADNEY